MKPLSYSRQHINEDDIAAVVRVLRSDYLTGGPEVEAFEAELAAYVGAKYAVAVSSGTAALHLAYLSAQTPPDPMAVYDDAIETSPLSFVATANAALIARMDVTFSDVDRATGSVKLLGIDEPSPGDYRQTICVPVHYSGRAAPIPGHPVKRSKIIEDACHALGAMDFDGCSRIGSCAHSIATAFSFHPVKPICTGEGGAITTNDPEFARKLRLMRSHGRDADGSMVKMGWNYRLTEMQAALGRSQLKRCDAMRGRREAMASLYVAAEMERFFGDKAEGPEWQDGGAWHLYPVRIKNGKRDAVKAALNAQGIGAQVHYSPIIPLQPYWKKRFGYKEGDFPEAEAWAREELSLPLHAGMETEDVDRVVQALRQALV